MEKKKVDQMFDHLCGGVQGSWRYNSSTFCVDRGFCVYQVVVREIETQKKRMLSVNQGFDVLFDLIPSLCFDCAQFEAPLADLDDESEIANTLEKSRVFFQSMFSCSDVWQTLKLKLEESSQRSSLGKADLMILCAAEGRIDEFNKLFAELNRIERPQRSFKFAIESASRIAENPEDREHVKSVVRELVMNSRTVKRLPPTSHALLA